MKAIGGAGEAKSPEKRERVGEEWIQRRRRMGKV